MFLVGIFVSFISSDVKGSVIFIDFRQIYSICVWINVSNRYNMVVYMTAF